MSAGLGALAPYNDELHQLLRSVMSSDCDDLPGAAAHLDGRASAEFRRLVPLAERRAAGTFFTGSRLRARAVERYRRSVAGGVQVVDPACGMGDLLLAAAELIPTSWAPSRRATHAFTRFYGRDLYAPLVEAAASRLALWAAVSRGGGDALASSPVEVGDAFADDLDWRRFGLVLLNPPYVARRLEQPEPWGSGSVTAAAPFTLDVVARARPGARIAAILPDVLRSGARYARWRDEIEKAADVDAIDVVGAFDRWTDVDVFVAHLRRRSLGPARPASGRWQPRDTAPGPRLREVAVLSVGDVVPHRDVPGGDESPYLTVDALPAWTTTLTTQQRIRHQGRLHEPPFIALRRTSGPTKAAGAIRARAAVYAGAGPVAVENHLIVIRPLDGTVSTCMRLMEAFRRQDATDWLDQRLRLRHLTVTVLADLPMPGLGVAAGTS
jgi:hypothetical protein